ncbi:MAG: sn-glycerol-3-phosphate import ATP-binding protein UgpC [Desulfobacterales bacterium]|nr:MAG: sn-glycerol-3-phosphate import ATP-binding protein UgpC [Desulfobacterales bacterium]
MADVSLKDVYKSFGKTEVIHGISCDIKDGEFIVILGPSGCGKSTVLRMIAGLEVITAGEIAINGEVVNQLEPADRDIAMVFQNYALYPHMTVYKNMAYGLRIRRMPKADIDVRVRNAAKILELTEFLDRKPRQLSGGQRQRVAMGRCIVREPKVFLFDEPLSNLDAKLRVQMRLEIRKLHEDLKITSVYVTHDQVEAMTLGDRLIVMDNGYAAQIGSPLDVYERPATRFVAGFIGSPAMNFLEVHLSSDGRSVEIPGDVSLPLANGSIPTHGGKEVILGIRPEHIKLAEEKQGDLHLRVDHVELLGADTLVHGHFGDEKTSLTIRIPDVQHFKKHTALYLYVPPRKMHLFDKETGKRIGG